MEMHQIRYFLAVSRTLNFTRAAEESNVSQPSLTRAIQKLEEEFGGLLFRRERSLTHLTDLGRQMLPHLERMFEAAEAARQLARGIGKVAVAPLNIGLATSVTSPQLSAAFDDVGTGLPGFQLRVVGGDTDALLADLLHGDLDIAILAEPRTPHDRLDLLALFTRDYGVVVPPGHPLATPAAAMAITMIDGIGWISAGGDIDAEFIDCCTAAGVTPDQRHRTTSELDALRLVGARLGCALAARDAALPVGVERLDIKGLSLSRRIVLATVGGRQRPPAGDALIRAVKARAWP